MSPTPAPMKVLGRRAASVYQKLEDVPWLSGVSLPLGSHTS